PDGPARGQRVGVRALRVRRPLRDLGGNALRTALRPASPRGARALALHVQVQRRRPVGADVHAAGQDSERERLADHVVDLPPPRGRALGARLAAGQDAADAEDAPEAREDVRPRAQPRAPPDLGPRLQLRLPAPAGRQRGDRPDADQGLTAEQAALARAKARLDPLELYPRAVRIDRVRVVVWPWFFRMPWFDRFDGHAAWNLIVLRAPVDAVGDDLVTHELCHVWQMQHKPFRMPLS